MTIFRKLESRIIGKGVNLSKVIVGQRVVFEWRPPTGFGRFGGGWEVTLGIQAGGSEVIMNLGVCSVRISRA